MKYIQTGSKLEKYIWRGPEQGIYIKRSSKLGKYIQRG
jgi:hypothetical protein